MKNILSLLFIFSLFILAGCAGPGSSPAIATPSPTPLPEIAPPSREWLAHAMRIKTDKCTIYYQGTADGAYTAGHKRWVGTIKGKVFVVFVTDKNGSTLMLPHGTITLGRDGEFHSSGPSKMSIHPLPAE